MLTNIEKDEENTMNRQLSTKDAINEAISIAMEKDKNVFIMGEDICGAAGNDFEGSLDTLGGAYGVTKGLATKFGRERVIDMPISETAFLGMGIGAAFAGMRPIIEIMYVDFIGVCYDQLFNQAAKMFFLYGGKKPVPMVLRMPCGAGYRAGGEHSQILYNMFASIPGLKVVTPSNAYDAKGLMLQAIKDNDPVVFLEHKKSYMRECEVPEEEYYIPFGKAKVVKSGTDVTVVALHRMVWESLEAAEELEKQGISVEVIDPRTISPLDMGTILESVKKTGRVIIADESYPRCGMAADISAQISEAAFDSLKKPIMRVIPPHSHIPFSADLEDEWIPSAEKIKNKILEILK